MLVDDEILIVKMEKQRLERLGYKVTTHTSSVEAFEEFCSDPDKFDLVITDMTMPSMTGAVLARKMMQIKSSIPIILCTGYNEYFTEENARSMGIKEYVMKPVLDLPMIVRKILDSP